MTGRPGSLGYPAPDRALLGRWQRLHPASPLVRAGPAVIVILVALALQRGNRDGDYIRLGVVVLLAAWGWISWLVTRWRVADNALHIETGLLRRSSLRFPLSQIQAVDIVRPALARMFGLAELRVRMASGGRSTGRLTYVPAGHAEVLRAQLLDMARSGTGAGSPVGISAPGVPARPAVSVTPFFQVDTARLVASIMLSGPAVILYALISGLIALAVLSPRAAAGLLAGSAITIFGFAAPAWNRLNGEYRLTLGHGADGLHLQSGLVQTTMETVPWGRVQAVRTLEPMLWRPFGWCRVEVDVAGRNPGGRQNRAAKQAGRALIPVGTRADADALAHLVMPGAPGDLAPPPGRARWKTPLRYRRLALATNAYYVVTTSGRLRKVTDRVPLAKVQSIRWSEGPWQRRFGLASLHFDTAGRSVFAVARDRDRVEAAALLASLPDACRRARSEDRR